MAFENRHGLVEIVLAGDRVENTAAIQTLDDFGDPGFQAEFVRTIFDENSVPQGVVQIPNNAFDPGFPFFRASLRLGLALDKIQKPKNNVAPSAMSLGISSTLNGDCRLKDLVISEAGISSRWKPGATGISL
jgi:hypothetical protein